MDPIQEPLSHKSREKLSSAEETKAYFDQRTHQAWSKTTQQESFGGCVLQWEIYGVQPTMQQRLRWNLFMDLSKQRSGTLRHLNQGDRGGKAHKSGRWNTTNKTEMMSTGRKGDLVLFRATETEKNGKIQQERQENPQHFSLASLCFSYPFIIKTPPTLEHLIYQAANNIFWRHFWLCLQSASWIPPRWGCEEQKDQRMMFISLGQQNVTALQWSSRNSSHWGKTN